MREWKDEAIILRLGLFHDADLWLRVLVRSYGLHTVFAFGGARSKRRFCGCLDVLNTLDCRITESRMGYMVLQEASLVSMPQCLRSNWQSLGIINNCLNFVGSVAIGPESAAESFVLLEDLRSLTENTVELSSYAPIVFRLRLAAALGFGPNFGQCAACGAVTPGGGIFLVNEGRFLCERCAASRRHDEKKYGFGLSGDAAKFLQLVQRQLPSQWDLTSVQPAVLRQAARAIDGFVQFHL